MTTASTAQRSNAASLVSRNRTPTRGTILRVASAVLLLAATGCRGGETTATREPLTLRVGFGLSAGTSPEIGIRQTTRNIALEGLVRIARDGRAVPVLAERWTVSEDGLAWRFYLRPPAMFHDGTPVTAEIVRTALLKSLPQAMGPAYEDVSAIHVVDSHTIEFSLNRPCTFLLDALDVHIQKPGEVLVGTGPFMVSTGEDQAEMRANERYYGGRPSIDRIDIVPYASVRGAWADLLRGQVDVLYDVGVEALDFLESSNAIRVFTFQRGYAFMMLLNVRKPIVNDSAFRRELNAALNREALVQDVFRGRGTPAKGAVWPQHWAYSADLPKFEYQPQPPAKTSRPRRLKCLFVDPSHERLALALQRQLQAVGIELILEAVPADQIIARLQADDFDAFLADFVQGPNLGRPYLFWHGGGPLNYGHFSSTQVDAALDSIRHSADDEAYKAGVAAFQRAIVDDPPAIFIAWRERARAVSRRFDVPIEPGADVFASLHLWRPAVDGRNRN
jgi:peptide/nickel transport system substrate-binding protein